MSSDNSRFTFDPRNNFQGVVMEQGKVQLDSDWNEWGSQNYRRTRAVNLDTLGLTVAPVGQTNGFLISTTTSGPQSILINPGRMYVDGLTAENHGVPLSSGGNIVWDPSLDENVGTTPVPYTAQPSLPGAALPTGPGFYLAYLDVWQRELTSIERPELIDKAVGVDTTGRSQTVWQVKLAAGISGGDSTQWSTLTQPSAAQLTTEPYTPGPNFYFIDQPWTSAAKITGVSAYDGVAIDPINSVVYVSSGNAIQRFDLNNGTYLGALSVATNLYQVQSIFFGVDGFLYLAEQQVGGVTPAAGSIYRVNTSTGQFLQIGPSSSAAGSNTVFPVGNRPTGVFVDLNGDVYVCTTTNTVYWFAYTGAPAPSYNVSTLVLQTGGSLPGITNLTGLFKWQDTLYLSIDFQVAAYTQVNVSPFNSYNFDETTFPAVTGFSPHQITMDEQGNVYAASSTNSSFMVRTSSGNVFASTNTVYGNPTGIGVDSQGSVYVGSTQINKIENTNQNQYTGLENQLYRVEVHNGGTPALLGQELSFSSPLENFGGSSGMFSNPSGVAVDGNGFVYVSNWGYYYIQKFDSSGNFVKQWGGFGTASGQFASVYDVWADGKGKIYVADTGNDRIQIFDEDGNFLFTFGKTGTLNGEFNTPYNVRTDVNGNIFVMDSGNARIQKFDANGNYLLQWAGPTGYAFGGNSGIAIDPSGQFLYTTNPGQRAIQKFDLIGNFISRWLGTTGGALQSPRGIATDAMGNVYVTDFNRPVVQVFDGNGNYLTEFGNSSTFVNPQGICVSANYVYVADWAIGGQGIVRFNVSVPTFKWSRENASVATRVLSIDSTNNRTLILGVENVGRDTVLGFSDGDWVELTDDNHELNGLPGEMHQIITGGVDSVNLTITVANGINGTSFTTQTSTTGNVRLKRWDQSGIVYRNDGQTLWYDLNSPQSTGSIPLPPTGVTLTMENGIQLTFDLDSNISNGQFKTFDYWTIAARTVDQSIQSLNAAPPQGIYHHYAQLATLSLSSGTFTVNEDLRDLWTVCDCGIWVSPYLHNNGIFTIQQAVNWAGGVGATVWLESGTYNMNPNNISGPSPSVAATAFSGVNPVVLRGQGESTILSQTNQITFVTDQNSVTIRDMKIVTTNTTSNFFPAISIGGQDILLSNITFDNASCGSLEVAGTDVVVENINILNGGPLGFETPTIQVSTGNAKNIRFSNIVAQNMPQGFLSIVGATNVYVEDATLTNSGGVGIITTSSAVGVTLREISCQTFNGQQALYIEESEQVVIENINLGSMPSSLGVTMVGAKGVSVKGLFAVQNAITCKMNVSQGVLLERINAGICSTALQIAQESSDILVRGFRAECSGVGYELYNSKRISISGLDLFAYDGPGVSVSACAGVVIEDSTIMLAVPAQAVAVLGCTGFDLRRVDLEVPGIAVNVSNSNDVNLEKLQVVSGCEGEAVISFGPQCINGRLVNSSIVANIELFPGSNPNMAAVQLQGWLVGTEIQGNSFQSPVGVFCEAGTYLASVGLLIENNLMICAQSGVSLQGNVFMTGVTRIAANTINSGTGGAITVTGSAYLGAAVEIASNQLMTAGPGITAGTDARITGNQITSATTAFPRPDSPAVVLSGGLDPIIAHCSVVDNRIIQGQLYGTDLEEAVLITAPVNNLIVSGNIIDGSAGGIMVRDEGSAQAALISGNSISNIITFENDDLEAGIVMFNVASLRISGNTINHSLVVRGNGIATVSCMEQHLSNNEVVGISGVVYANGVSITGPFDRADLFGNEIRNNNSAISTDPVGPIAIELTGLSVQSPTAISSGGAVYYFSSDKWVVNLDGTTLLTANGNGLSVTTWPTGRVESLRVLGNRIESSILPGGVGIEIAGECHFADNYCSTAVPAISFSGTPVILSAGSAIINDNRFRGGTLSLDLILPSGAPLVIMNNMATQPLQLNGGALPTAWLPYNVTA